VIGDLNKDHPDFSQVKNGETGSLLTPFFYALTPEV
jgi:hypothetical protein